jgi:NuA3 HAT complex component NTO1
VRDYRYRLETQRNLIDLARQIQETSHKNLILAIGVYNRWKYPLYYEMKSLLEHLKALDPKGIFATPVSPADVPDYYDVIKNPMDYSTMTAKISNQDYDTLDDMVKDFEKICTNAMIYNKSSTRFFKAAEKMKREGMKAIRETRALLEEKQIGDLYDTLTVDALCEHHQNVFTNLRPYSIELDDMIENVLDEIAVE